LRSAATIARGAPMTQTSTKRSVDAAAGLPFACDAAEVQALADACFDSADFAEGPRRLPRKAATNRSSTAADRAARRGLRAATGFISEAAT
jgi:enoyl-CoA hydratase/carnithine racemase